MTTWRQFERLAASIYQELSPGAVVTHDDHIHGEDTGIDRQIDVSVRYELAGHKLLLIIQARDQTDSADVNAVGEFASVVRDVRANKGILICRGGFSTTAIAYAKQIGIDVCNIHDAETTRWNLKLKLPVLWIDLLPEISLALQVRFEAGDRFPNDPRSLVFSNDKGVTHILPLDTFVRRWNAGELRRDVGPRYGFTPTQTGIELLIEAVDGSNAWRPVSRLQLSYTVKQKAWLGSMEPAKCRGVLNYIDGKFRPTFLPLGEIPFQRDDSWTPIDDVEAVAVSPLGVLITAGTYRVNLEGLQLDPIKLRRVSD